MSFLTAPPFVSFSSTWAALPAASAVAVGTVAFVSDFNGYWRSDGSYWHPLNGSAVLYSKAGSVAAPLVSAAGSGVRTNFVLPTPMLLPAKILPPNSRLEAFAVLYKTSVETGVFSITLSNSAAAVGTTLGQSPAANAANPSAAKLVSVCMIGTDEFTQMGGLSDFASIGSTSVPVTTASVGINATVDKYVTIDYGSGFSAAATLSVISYSLRLICS